MINTYDHDCGEITTKTGKVITWTRAGDKMIMHCNGVYAGESTVRLSSRYQLDHTDSKY